MPHSDVPSEHRAFARGLRKDATSPERVLWWGLSRRQLCGWRFRRQVPCGRFVLDFFCPKARLAVEIDGNSHVDPEKDARRDAWIASQGIRVIRFSDYDVMSELDMVLDTILRELEEPGE